ncbi:MAG: extracellular solute-binding protein [Deltaproteobacteria bacterium]|nr:extracellular solute-binding protein [Deltaproteobacteria bacterium]
MKFGIVPRVSFSLLLGLFVGGSDTFAASVDADLEKAGKEAEAKGYAFITSHEEIVTKAKMEGGLRVLAEMQAANIKASTAAFIKKYPFIKLHIEQITGTDSAQRNILEIKSGAAMDWDILHLSTDFYNEYIPHLKRIDLLGMARHGVLRIPPPMIDPINRNIVAFFTRFQVTAYNQRLVPPNRIPKTWEDLLKPEFKGRKFAADIRPTEIAGLAAAWGLEKTLDFARRISAQQPIWVRGGTRTLTAIIAGEIPIMIGPNFGSLKRAQRRDPTDILHYVILEPVPLRLTLAEAIHATSKRPHAALLWFEWMASPEAQKYTDEHEPFDSSVYVRGGAVEQELRGRKLSVMGWEHHQNIDQWQAKIFEAYGFPKAEKSR